MNRLIRLYPAAWRERYGEELAALLVERPPTFADRIDIVRGALDARMHAQVPGRPIPRSHRLPGIAALAAGLAYSAFFIGVAVPVVDSEEWGAFTNLIGVAIVLAFISLPGTYFERYIRGLKWGFVSGIVLFALAAVAPWPLKSIAGLALVFLIAGGMLGLAAARAGLSARARWPLVLLVLVPQSVLALGLYAVGAGATGDDAGLVLLFVLPYGLAWVAVGLLMTVRGTPTFDDRGATDTPIAAAQVEGPVR